MGTQKVGLYKWPSTPNRTRISLCPDRNGGIQMTCTLTRRFWDVDGQMDAHSHQIGKCFIGGGPTGAKQRSPRREWSGVLVWGGMKKKKKKVQAGANRAMT